MMSAAKRHISSLLSNSPDLTDRKGILEETEASQPVKRPRIQELSPGSGKGPHASDAVPGTNSIKANDVDGDQSSILSTSSSETSSFISSSDEDDEASQSAAHAQDPPTVSSGSLRTRLATFLPRLHESNQSLDPRTASAFELIDKEDEDTEQAAGRAEDGKRLKGAQEDDKDDDDDIGPYIEMNLGLGVLEQRRSSDAWSSSSNSSEDDVGEEGDSDTHVLGRLMGQRGMARESSNALRDTPKGSGIQEL